MLILTQSLRDACIAEEDVRPLGFTIQLGPIRKGRSQAVKGVCEQVKDTFPQCDLIVNVKFNFRVWGHPSNGEWECELVGDCYTAISQDLKEKCK